MRHQNVRGEAAIDRDTEIAIVAAQIFLAATAGGAGPTTDPGINGNAAADDRGVGVAADALDHAGDFMTECERQCASGGLFNPGFDRSLAHTSRHSGG